MQEILQAIASDKGTLIPAIVFLTGGTIAIVAIVIGGVTTVLKSRNDSRTRREIAAYVAEGSIKAEDAERILRATPPDQS
jgi:hypothetical protein